MDRIFRCSCRKFQTSLLQKTSHVTKSPSNCKSVRETIKCHLRNSGLSDDYLSKIPSLYYKRCIKAKNILIADPQVAQNIASIICSRLRGEYILEFDAGIGLMSDVFVAHGCKLRLYEHNKELALLLRYKFENSVGKVTVFPESFYNLIGILFSEEVDAEKDFKKLANGIPIAPWTENITMSMIIPVSSIQHIRALLTHSLLFDSLRQFGRPEIFFLVPRRISQILTSPQDEQHGRYTAVGYVYNIFCDIEILLEEIPAKSILPWHQLEIKQLNVDESFEEFVLLRVVPKVDRFAPIEKIQFLKAFLTMTRRALKKHTRVIQTFESYIENCGPQFILEYGLTSYTEFFDLTPETYYLLFRELVKYPHVYESMSKSSLNDCNL